MKKAKFVFQNGYEEVYNTCVEYILEGDVLRFSLDDVDYKIDFKKEEFIRTAYDEEFRVCANGAHLSLLKEGFNVDIKVSSFIYEKTQDFCSIRYNIETDEGITKKLTIHL